MIAQIGAAILTEQRLGATPWLVFTGERRRDVLRADLALSNSEGPVTLDAMCRGLSRGEHAAYGAKASLMPRPNQIRVDS